MSDKINYDTSRRMLHNLMYFYFGKLDQTFCESRNLQPIDCHKKHNNVQCKNGWKTANGNRQTSSFGSNMSTLVNVAELTHLIHGMIGFFYSLCDKNNMSHL